MARERLCWAPWTGPTKRTTPQSCDESLRRLGLRCPLMRRHHNARRCFELTGQVMPIHSPALVDLVGRVAGAPPENSNNRSQPTTSLSRAGSYMPPVAAGMAPRVEVAVHPA